MAATEAYAPGSAFEVQDSPEFQRVLGLRRRIWEDEVAHNDLYLRMTQAFKLPPGQQTLRPIQAAALADAHDMNGLLAPVRVGEGKTHLSFLLPVIIPGVQRPTLLLPAALVEKTWREFCELRKHWQCHPTFLTRKGFDAAVMSYEILGRESGKARINERKPDLLVSDECHRLRNRQAACTKRVERFMIANPHTIFCGMSGTITKRSIRDYWHLLYWALRHNMPLPRHEHEMEKWAEAIDERKSDAISRRGPGVLLSFCTPEEVAEAYPERTAPLGRTAQMPEFGYNAKLNAARVGYQRRFRETPGVICSPDRNLDCSLVIRRRQVNTGPIIADHLHTLRSSQMTPNGDLLALPTDIWRFAREIACGFYYRWEPPPPIHWLTARKNWNWFVRQVLDVDGIYREQFAWLHLDSPMQVALAIKDGHIHLADVKDAYYQWANVRGDYKINVVDEWLDDTMLDFCQAWMTENKSGIVWTEHRAFGMKVAERLKTGFCSNGGLDANGVTIEDYAGKPVVASVPANYMGRNLQAWNKNLIVTAPPTGSIWEQLLGRTHRMGQEEDTVYVDWVSACDEQDQGFQQLLADARYIQDTTGQSQKLLFADRIG